MPTIQFASSPTSSVPLTRFAPADFPTFVGLFPPNTTVAQGTSFVLENRNQRRILAVAVVYVVKDSTGRTHREIYKCDSFVIAGVHEVALPAAKVLVAPGGIFMPESLLSGGRHFFGLDPAVISTADESFRDAKEISVSVNSIVFEDGEVVGPDDLQLAAEITARKAVAESLVAKVRAATAAGQSPLSALPQTTGLSEKSADPTESWTVRYVRRLQRSRNQDTFINYLDSLPRPPKFFRKSAGN